MIGYYLGKTLIKLLLAPFWLIPWAMKQAGKSQRRG